MAKKKFIQNDNNKAICYYRYSSHAQNDASIEQQQELAKEYAEAHGYTIVKEYADRAMSGTTADRPQYQLMLSEVKKLKPAVLILWKTDRLSRDRFEAHYAKTTMREAGCAIKYIAEAVDEETAEGQFMASILEGMAEFYSNQLRINVTRGMQYNASHCLYNGHKTLGYTVDDTKHYIEDTATSGVVRRIFNDFADGKPMVQICNELNDQGIRTVLGRQFTHNGMRSILKNRMYIGEYHYGDIVTPGGVPALISEELFYRAQARFEKNKHKAIQPEEDEAPRFWLSGKLFCGKCGTTMHGMSGTSRHGYKCYYYACKNARKHSCKLKAVRKDALEAHVLWLLRSFLEDTEMVASLAVDIAEHHKKINADDSYMKSLEADLKEAEKAVANLVKVIEKGVMSDAVLTRLTEMEERQKAIMEAIETEKIKKSLADNTSSIQKYFDMYMHADFDDDETRNTLLEYFVDKIYVYDDKLVITWFYSDDHAEIDLDALTECTEDESAEGSTLSCSGPYEKEHHFRGVLFRFMDRLAGIEQGGRLRSSRKEERLRRSDADAA